MNEQKLRAQIQDAVNRHVPGGMITPYRVQRVLRDARWEGEPKVKKKLSAGLVLVIVLMLMTLTALAIGLSLDDIWQQSFDKMNTTGVMDIVSYPQETDMQPEEAVALAKSAIIDLYGTTEEEFSRMGVYPRFYARGWDPDVPDKPAEWHIYFSSRRDVDIDVDTNDYGPDGEYRVYINAESGEVTYCHWYTNNFWAQFRRIWDCGSYDKVYWHYQQPDFYTQSPEQQAYVEQLLAGQGYELTQQDNRRRELLKGVYIDVLYLPADAFLDASDPQAAAAWDAVEERFGYDADLLRKHMYVATRLSLHTGTDDIIIGYNYHAPSPAKAMWTDRMANDAIVCGMFMISFEPGTTEIVDATHLRHTDWSVLDPIDEGPLYARRDWTADDLIAYDAAFAQVARAEERWVYGAKHSIDDFEPIFDDFMNRLGADPSVYPALPDDVDVSAWFSDDSDWDAQISYPTITATEAREAYGFWYFWPLEVKAEISPAECSLPRPGEMTEAEARAIALQAVTDAYGADALVPLGDYAVGCELHRFENEGEITRWHFYISDDPGNPVNGFKVVFAFRDGVMIMEPQVQYIADGGNG